jgi:4-amino-4-deoxy-L-arabinose transferase-like glycosyltransferase
LLKIPAAAQYESGTTFLYEGKQGPLYYWLMAPLYSAIRNTTLPTRVFVFRLVNVLLAALIFPIAFFAAQKAFSSSRIALVVCALIAAMPELYIDVARVGNQVLAMLLYGVFTLLLLLIAEGKIHYLPVAGFVLGLLLLAKGYGLAGVPALAVVALYSVVRAPRKDKLRVALLNVSAWFATFAIATWWYLRNLRLWHAIVWIDGAPQEKKTLHELLGYTLNVHWSSAIDSLIGSHIWFGNWSFLSVRSWMYRVFEYAGVLVAVGLILTITRSLIKNDNNKGSPAASALFVNLVVYGTFVSSIGYHIVIDFINQGVSASAGWYLYAVIVPESILITAGLLVFRWGHRVLTGVIACFFVLEMYATHFVLIPYYTGLISHAPSGGLRAFHISKLRDTGLTGLLARLEINRVFLLSDGVWIGCWLLFLSASFALVLEAIRLQHGEPGIPQKMWKSLWKRERLDHISPHKTDAL